MPAFRWPHLHLLRSLAPNHWEPHHNELFSWLLTPNLTYLAHLLHSQPAQRVNYIDSQRLPKLTHSHVGCIIPATESVEWMAAVERLKVTVTRGTV